MLVFWIVTPYGLVGRHVVTTQKTNIHIFTAVRTFSFIIYDYFIVVPSVV
jgi:hypothetical protein